MAAHRKVEPQPVVSSGNLWSPKAYEETRSWIDGVDEVARAMELRWGVDRLRLLVGDDLRARFDRQAQKWNDAIWSGSLADVKVHAEGMRRGWQALDKAATEAGAQHLHPEVWEAATPSGRVVAIVRTSAEAHHVAREHRDMEVWTMAEVGRMVEHYANSIGAVKDAFPGACVVGVKRSVADTANPDGARP